MAEHNSNLVVDLPKLAQFLKWFPHRNPDLSHDELNQEAYKILPEKDFSTLVEFLGGSTFDKKAANRDFYLDSSRLFALYLRPILLTVPFVFYKEDNDIMDFIEFIKDHYCSGKSPSSFKLPQALEDTISDAVLPYLKKTRVIISWILIWSNFLFIKKCTADWIKAYFVVMRVCLTVTLIMI
jgi:hypothetical protein